MDIASLKDNYVGNLKKHINKLFGNKVKWNDLLSNKERVRYLYRQLIIKSIHEGYKFKPHLTPGETMKDLAEWKQQDIFSDSELTSLYNRVRYGDEDVDDSVVDEVKEYL